MRTLGLLLLCLLAAAVGPFLRGELPSATRLDCEPIVAVIEADGVERLACLDDPALASCPKLIPGERYEGCEARGPIRGPVLAMRGLPVDVNRASAEDLRALPRIGQGMAQRIVEGRQEAPYCRASDLARVPGIGEKRSVKLGAHLSFAHSLCDDPAAQ